MLKYKLKNKNIIFNKKKSSWPSNLPNQKQDVLTYKKDKNTLLSKNHSTACVTVTIKDVVTPKRL